MCWIWWTSRTNAVIVWVDGGEEIQPGTVVLFYDDQSPSSFHTNLTFCFCTPAPIRYDSGTRNRSRILRHPAFPIPYRLLPPLSPSQTPTAVHHSRHRRPSSLRISPDHGLYSVLHAYSPGSFGRPRSQRSLRTTDPTFGNMDPPRETEAELESFRRQWREELSARARNANGEAGPSNTARPQPGRRKSIVPPPPPKTLSKRPERPEGWDEIEPRAYHDLPDKEAELKLGVAGQGLVRGASAKEPKSALEHYEKAVEKETQGSLGDSLALYRKAFKVSLYHTHFLRSMN